MAARKLHMPGARERISVGAGAGAEAGVVQNGNDVCVQPTGGSRHESRFASPIMQPLPLASRYGGAKNDSLRPSSAALQSTWIQRLRPASPDGSCREFGHEVAHVWRDPQPPLWRSNTPLLLAGPCKETLHHPVPSMEPQLQQEDQHQADDSDDRRLMEDTEQAGASKSPSRKIDCVDKGKARSQVQVNIAHETTMTAGQRKNDHIRTSQTELVKPSVFSSCSKGFVAVEGSSRRQGLDSPQGNNRMSMPSCQNPQPNGVSGGLVTGFGPLRVPLKPPSGNTFIKSVASGSKLKEPAMESIQAADVPTHGSHYMVGPDRNRATPSPGPQVMMTCVPGTSTQPAVKRSADPNLDIDHGKRIVQPGELFGGGFYPFQRTGYGSDNCEPSMIHQSQAPGKDRMYGYEDCSNGNRSAAGFHSVGDNHPIAHSMKGWYSTFSAIGSGVDGVGKGMSATHSFVPIMAGEGRIDCGKQQEGRATEKTSGKPVYVPNGLEARQAKEVGVTEQCFADVGRSQQQTSQFSPLFAPYQTPHISFGKQPLPFSPARSLCVRAEEDARPGEGEDSSQERSQKTSSFAPFRGHPKPRQDGVEGTSRKPPWSSLFAAYKVSNHPGEPPHSNASTGTLPLDGRLRIHEGQNRGNHVSNDPRASGNRDNESGGSVKTGVHPAASSAEARSLFDNQSSQFSSSPWPVDGGHNPTDDTGSAFQSQASHTSSFRVPSAIQAPNAQSKRQENNRYKCDVGGSSLGGSKDVSYKRARNREHSESFSPVLRNSSGGMEGSRGLRSLDEENHARGPLKNLRQPPMPSFSGQKDDTSGSSPPSLPLGCNNSSDLCSPAFPGAGVEDGGQSRAVQSRTAHLESEADVIELGKRQQGMVSIQGGSGAKRRERSEPEGQINLGLRSDPGESSARLCKDVDTQEAQPMVGEAFRESGGDLGQKQSRLRNSSDVVGEADTSVPSKRSRHHPNQGSWDFQGGGSGVQPREKENGVGTGKPSTWLSRWLPSGTNGNGRGASMHAPTSGGPKGPWNGLAPGPPSNGRINFAGRFAGDGLVQGSRAGGQVGRMDENGSDQWENMKELSSKKAVFGLPPYPTPSAAAMALMGTAARKLGPLPSQRRGPISMFPPVHLETTHTPEPQKSVRSSELPTYVEQS